MKTITAKEFKFEDGSVFEAYRLAEKGKPTRWKVFYGKNLVATELRKEWTGNDWTWEEIEYYIKNHVAQHGEYVEGKRRKIQS